MQPVHRSEVLAEPAIQTYDTGDLATTDAFAALGNVSALSSRRTKRDLKRAGARQTLRKLAAAGTPPAPEVKSYDRAELTATTVFTNSVSTNDSSRSWKSNLVARSPRHTLRRLVAR